MPGQAGAPLGLTLTLVDPMLAARCCASFTKDPRRRHNGRLREEPNPIVINRPADAIARRARISRSIAGSRAISRALSPIVHKGGAPAPLPLLPDS
jgi:hypothetical protein